MSALVSQATIDYPQVLCIGEDSKLTREIKKFLQEQEFEVVYLPIDKNLQTSLDKLNNQQFYKTILIYGFEEYNFYYFSQLVEFLQSKKDSLITLLPWPREIMALNQIYKKIYKEWIDISIKRKKIYLAGKNLNALKIYALDLVDSDQIQYPTKIFFLALKQNLVLDPQIFLYLQSYSTFLKDVKTLLLKPHDRKTYYFHGKQEDSMKFVVKISEFYQKYYQQSLARRVIEVKNIILSVKNGTQVVLKENLNAFLDSQTRLIPKFKQLLKDNLLKKEDALIAEPKPFALKSKKTQIGKQLKSLKNSNQTSPPFAPHPTPPIDTENQIDAQLAQLFTKKRVSQKLNRSLKKVVQVKKIKRKSKKKTILFYLGLIFSTIGGIFLLAVVSFFLTFNFFKKDLISCLINLEQQDAGQEIVLDQKERFASKFLTTQLNIYLGKISLETFTQAKLLLKIQEKIQAWQKIQQKQQLLLIAVYQQSIQNQEDQLNQPLVDELVLNTQQAFELLAGLRASYKQINQTQFEVEQQQALEVFLQKLIVMQKNTSKQLQLQQSLNKLLGIKGNKNYALVLQDNQEIRPSGGFIQAVAWLSFKNGQLIDTQVKGVYQLDQEVPGEIELPEEMRPYLAEKNWFFHDSNWEVDFPVAASKIAWFLKQINNRQLDGIITLNYSSLAEALDAVGELNLPNFALTLNKKNFLYQAENQLENKVNAASGKYFAEEVLEQFVKKLQTLSAKQILSVLLLTNQQFEQNQQLISVFDPKLQQTLDDLAWTGRVVTPQCPSVFLNNECLVDSLYLAETNIGLNKINQHIQRKGDHHIYLSDQSIEHQYQIEFNNTAFTNNYPLGVYKSYLRIYLPKNAVVGEILINNKPINSATYHQTITNDKKLLGLTLEVPIQKTAVLSLNYSQKQQLLKPFSYVFFNQKQPGVSPIPITTTVYFHPSLKPMLIAPQAEVTTSGIVFSTQTQEHDFFAIRFE